jgi:hypothetical protein
MACGQQSGAPASSKQVQELLTLLQEAGHDDFRDARGPMGFTQRQAAGKFTRDEATAFIEQLQEAGPDGDSVSGESPSPATRPKPARLSATEQALRKASAEQLAAELQSRGWVVLEP